MKYKNRRQKLAARRSLGGWYGTTVESVRVVARHSLLEEINVVTYDSLRILVLIFSPDSESLSTARGCRP